MNLIIDIGNTFTKINLFENKQMSFSHKIKTDRYNELFSIINDEENIKNTIISSVIKLDNSFIENLRKVCDDLIILDEFTNIPLINRYESVASLGKDRIAAAVGAYTIFPKTNVLAIDAGTALTFEFISEKTEYLGGNISPGLSMRFKALNYFTNKLPLIEKKENFPFLAKNTEDAIVSGVQNGIIFEIDNYIKELRCKYPDLKVILTGGDSFFFAHKLKSPIFAELFLTAIGLNTILEYNVKDI